MTTSHLCLLASLILFLIGYRNLPPHEASLVSISAAFCLYVGIGIANARVGNWPLCVVWFAYSISQLGFGWAEWQQWGKR